jgi:hypothetical protein
VRFLIDDVRARVAWEKSSERLRSLRGTLPVAPVRSHGSGSPVPIRNDPLATLRKYFGQRQVGE